MDKYAIEGTPKTPSISFDLNGGVLEIKGRSIPENSIEFYKPLVDSLDKYSSAAKTATTVNVQLEYFNTSSSKCILDVFKKLEKSFEPTMVVIPDFVSQRDKCYELYVDVLKHCQKTQSRFGIFDVIIIKAPYINFHFLILIYCSLVIYYI